MFFAEIGYELDIDNVQPRVTRSFEIKHFCIRPDQCFNTFGVIHIEIARKQMSNGGGIVSFEVKGGVEAGRKFLDNLKMLSMTNNLGDSRSIASHPASTTHSKLTDAERQEVGISPGLIRISVGLEHPDDILKDIFGALENS